MSKPEYKSLISKKSREFIAELKGRDLIARINRLEHELKRLDQFEKEFKDNPCIIICKRNSRQAEFYDQMERPEEYRGRAQTFDVPPDINPTELIEDAYRSLRLRKQSELEELIKTIS